jgi:phosphoribosylaminoimidazolecarboxamide formyltransferase/IMP cyclohydrolase
VVDPADYPRLLSELRAGAGGLTLSQRFEYASKAFAHTAKYDAAIFGYLVRQDSRQVPQTYVLQNRPRPK